MVGGENEICISSWSYFTHESLFIGLGECCSTGKLLYDYIYDFAAPERAASLINKVVEFTRAL